MKLAGEDEQDVGNKEVFWLSAYILDIVLIPLVIGLLIGLISIAVFLT